MKGTKFFNVIVVMIYHVGDEIPLASFNCTSDFVHRYDGEIPIVIGVWLCGGGGGCIADGLPDDTGNDGGCFDDGHFRCSGLDYERLALCLPTRKECHRADLVTSFLSFFFKDSFLKKKVDDLPRDRSSRKVAEK